MAKLKIKKMLLILLAPPLIIFPVKGTLAQYYYVNGYSEGIVGTHNNTLYKIDLERKAISDSIIADFKGEFADKKPTQISIGNRWNFLISFMVNGLPGKNTQPMDNVNTYYFIVNKQTFSIVLQDVLAFSQVIETGNINADSLSLIWIDDSANRGVLRRSKYLFNRLNNQFAELERHDYNSETEEEVIIGSYINPYVLWSNDEIKYYYDFSGDSFVNIFSTQNDTDIISETYAGDYSQESIILGYSPVNNRLYNFNLRFKLLSMYLPPESPDSVSNTVTIMDGSSFDIINTIELDLGDIYLAKELNEAEYIDGYLVYYFAQSDGYGRFDPAYLLIFDTRTNEASWLRVGWR